MSEIVRIKSIRTAITLVLATVAFWVYAPVKESELLAGRPLKTPSPAPESDSQPHRADQLPDGIYLYGQSSTPDQVQKEYFIFELRRGKVIGAFYLPRSDFYCFWGIFQAARLDVTVVDTFDRTTSPYSVNLQDYYRLSAVSNNDHRILRQCKDTYQQQVWGE